MMEVKDVIEVVIPVIVALLALVCSMFGWQISSMKKEIDDLRRNKADLHDVAEIKADLKQILVSITKLQVEQSRWQGRQEVIDKKL